MSIVDANILLRYLLDDHPDLSTKAAEILEQQTVTAPMEVACEVVYVLQKVYAVERQEIRQTFWVTQFQVEFTQQSTRFSKPRGTIA